MESIIGNARNVCHACMLADNLTDVGKGVMLCGDCKSDQAFVDRALRFVGDFVHIANTDPRLYFFGRSSSCKH